MTALVRWRRRCWDAAFCGIGVPSGRGCRPEHVRRGVKRAWLLGVRYHSASALTVLQYVSEELGRVEITTDGRRDHSRQGLRLACAWLREEIERDQRGELADG